MPSEPAKSSAPSAASSFASLLAGLTAPRDRASDRLSEDLLADDVVNISYEQALRTHARYHPTDPLPATASQPDPTLPKPPQSVRITEWFPDSELPPPLAANCKSASITIRMSQGECAQLRRRAADAGLTVSAYLRSCIFEVETLRAQVKQALAQFKPASAAEPQAPAPLPQAEKPARSWTARLFHRRSRSRA